MQQQIITGDCLEKLKDLTKNSVDLVLTDPPYFIDGLGDDWDKNKLDKKGSSSLIGGLPKGMKFDKKQGKNFCEFYKKVSKECFRVLKPGGIFLSFSQARLYHQLAYAVDSTKFEVRDMLGWTYKGQAKAFSHNHFIKKKKSLTDLQKEELIKELEGWKSLQLAPCIEPICLAQKPVEGTYIDNWIKWKVGFLNTKESLDGKFPGNIIKVSKPSKEEKKDYNDHLSVKPLTLIEHLIKLFTLEDSIVLDPFLGSGTTLVACKNTNRNGIGIELSEHYVKIAERRLKD